jgi:XRE family aerobic/anaerobic benzoate catabolism transcriptional regulator
LPLMKEPSAAAVAFGQRVRELRTKRRLTQRALAEAAGIPQTHVSAIELGVMLPSLITVIRLSIALGCKVATLVAPFDKADPASLLPQ